VRVDVTEAGFAPFWQNDTGVWKPLPFFTARKIENNLALAKQNNQEGKSLPVTFQPRSGLGVFARQGKATFRNIRVEPLP
jgi:hypothetical protein